ncbi:MAG: hypothetical protein ACU0GG_20990 [Paracoccaceae bacterium]
MFQLIGQGDLVATHGKRQAGGNDMAALDVYQVGTGLISEHRMNEEDISA